MSKAEGRDGGNTQVEFFGGAKRLHMKDLKREVTCRSKGLSRDLGCFEIEIFQREEKTCTSDDFAQAYCIHWFLSQFL